MRATPDRQAASIEFASRAGRIPLPLASSLRPPPLQGESSPFMDAYTSPTHLRDELAQGLMQRQAQISPKFLYDAHGCALFEQITELPEYYPTRTEAAIMARYDLPDAPMDVATRLIREAGVITIPGDSFGPGGTQSLRLSFGGDDAELDTACDRLADWLAAERRKR